MLYNKEETNLSTFYVRSQSNFKIVGVVDMIVACTRALIIIVILS